MIDTLIIGFDKGEEIGKTAISVLRNQNGMVRVLKVESDEQADLMYKVLTQQGYKIVEAKEQEE